MRSTSIRRACALLAAAAFTAGLAQAAHAGNAAVSADGTALLVSVDGGERALALEYRTMWDRKSGTTGPELCRSAPNPNGFHEPATCTIPFETFFATIGEQREGAPVYWPCGEVVLRFERFVDPPGSSRATITLERCPDFSDDWAITGARPTLAPDRTVTLPITTGRCAAPTGTGYALGPFNGDETLDDVRPADPRHPVTLIGGAAAFVAPGPGRYAVRLQFAPAGGVCGRQERPLTQLVRRGNRNDNTSLVVQPLSGIGLAAYEALLVRSYPDEGSVEALLATLASATSTDPGCAEALRKASTRATRLLRALRALGAAAGKTERLEARLAVKSARRRLLRALDSAAAACR